MYGEGLLSHYTEKYTSMLLKLVFKNQIRNRKDGLPSTSTSSKVTSNKCDSIN